MEKFISCVKQNIFVINELVSSTDHGAILGMFKETDLFIKVQND
jgi:hypothetical protein